MAKSHHKEQILRLCKIVLQASGPQRTMTLCERAGEMYKWVPDSRGLSQWLYADKRFHRHGYARFEGASYTLWCLTSLCLHKERTLSLRHPHNETDFKQGV